PAGAGPGAARRPGRRHLGHPFRGRRAGRPDGPAVGAVGTRVGRRGRSRRHPGRPGVTARQFTPPPDVAVAPVIAGGVPALRVTPEISSPATVLFLHGGGHVAGSAFGYRHLAAAIALAARAPALVIDYRLAPEHPYPAAVQD